MKTRIYILWAIAGIAVMSCVKESTEIGYTFEAGRENFETPTKTTISSGNMTLWTAGDEVAVYADGNDAIKCTAAGTGESTGFHSEGELNGSSFRMIYPYEAALGIQEDAVKVRVPQCQEPVLNGFDPKAAISVASTEDLSTRVMFRNALTLLKFTIPAHLDGQVAKISVESISEEPIAGDITIDMGDLSNGMIADGQAYTTAYIESESGLEAGNYFIAIRPCAIAEGIKVTASLTDGENYVRKSGATSFAVNYIYNFGSVADALDIPRDWYITPSGDASADGSSWQTATTFDNALAQAVEGSRLHLAAGTYKPDVALPYVENDAPVTATDAHKSFAVTRNISIYGGYPATPADGAVADPSTNMTILDGDGKSYHTLIVAAPKTEGKKVVIDGINITGGNNSEASKDLTVTYNEVELAATAGAGLLASNNVTLNNVNIYGNTANVSALYCTKADITMRGCNSTDNTSSNNGGGAYFTGCNAEITDCSFDRNTGAMGAASLILNSTVNYTDCTFRDNRNSNNGIIYAYTATSGSVEVVFDNCIISGNSAADGAQNGIIGTIYCYHNSSGTHKTYILNSVISQNYANSRGGGMYVRNAKAQGMNLYCVNTTFANNSAGSTGSAITFNGATTADIISCTVTGNESRATNTNIGAFTCESATNTINFYNTVAAGNRTTGEDACDVNIKNASATVTYKSSFIGSQYYGADGVASASTFDYTTMLGAFSDGVCPLLQPATNPAFTAGMSGTELQSLASGAVTADILGQDQLGNSRTSAVAGAYVSQNP